MIDHHFPHATGHILGLDHVRSRFFLRILGIFTDASAQIGISFVVLHYQSIFIGVMRCLFQARFRANPMLVLGWVKNSLMKRMV